MVSPKALDPVWDIFIFLCLAIFIAEIILSCISIKGFFNSYFFYLDLISCLSMIMDYTPIRLALVEIRQVQGTSVDQISKFIRLVRLFRLIRIGKIYKSLGQERKAKGAARKESNVGKELGNKVSKIVIIICFVLLIFLPIFNPEFWEPNYFGIQGLCFAFTSSMNYNFPHRLQVESFKYNPSLADYPDKNDLEHTLNTMTKGFIEDLQLNNEEPLILVRLKPANHDYYIASDYEQIRPEEMRVSECNSASGTKIRIEQRNRNAVVFETVLDLIRGLYISVILIGGANLFSKSTCNLVIKPIENIMEKIKKLIELPQKFRELAFIEQEAEEEEKVALESRQNATYSTTNQSKGMAMETQALEDPVKNIGILLGVVFGEAGTNLIGRYLGSEGDVNVMVEGEQIEAVYGFCDIRNFTDATEVLQQEFMLFVNTIANIVHSLTDQALGNANKNVGDAFLLVWKMTRNRIMNAEYNGVEPSVVYTNLADLALYSIMKIYAEVSRSFSLTRYANHPGLKQRIGRNYKVRLGFGLHAGWSIEGAIGSHHKIDVSYLSAHVNKAGKLESLCKAYGCVALLSGELFQKLSRFGRRYCREVDVVLEKASRDPFRISPSR